MARVARYFEASGSGITERSPMPSRVGIANERETANGVSEGTRVLQDGC
jgi:hypothetical protein